MPPQTIPDFSQEKYHGIENEKIHCLDRLFNEWISAFNNHEKELLKHKPDDIVSDGFYPNYFNQKRRILFIGREPRDLTGCSYIEALYKAYKSDEKKIGNQHINQNRFHSRILYITYGILHEMPRWEEIPLASDICDSFGESHKGSISYAFMNFSKFSNNSHDWTSDWPIIDQTHKISTEGRNFLKEEIRILAPEIVITMNLGPHHLTSLGALTPLEINNMPHVYWLDTGETKALLINTFHFSCWKNPIISMYNPICNAIKKYLP